MASYSDSPTTTTASSTAPDAELATLLDDLFFEQDTRVLGQLYRHGVLRTALVVGRALLGLRGGWRPSAASPAPHTTVAVVFFENEYQAARAAPPGVAIDEIVRLDLTSLPLIRGELGIGGTLRETWRFAAAVVRSRGARYLGRLSIPLLGWLLYRTFCRLLRERQPSAVVTTNMQHPASIAVHWAARRCGCAALFYEHATTPSLVFNDRGYQRLFVNFEHTRRMMIGRGAAPEKIEALRALGVQRAAPPARLRSIGVCINDLDSAESVAAVTAELQQRGLAVSYRLHDADPRLGYFRERATALGLEFGSARTSRISEFLAGVDLVITGNSNVVADALLAGKPVVYYWAGAEEMFDYYGFVGYYQLPHARTPRALAEVLGELESSRAC